MNILFIASTDSYNTELLVLAKTAVARGHQSAILLTHADDAHNRMLFDEVIPHFYWHEFEHYAAYDAFVYGNIFNQQVCQKVRAQNKLKVGLFFHLVIDDYVLGGENLHADFSLCYGQRLVDMQKRNGLVHNLIPTGPPFSTAVHNEQNTGKSLLFLEQHFYPSGDKGKQQLADFLTELAISRPDYNITVKPRTLESDKDPRHKARHIYSYFRKSDADLPRNLHLLREHRDLEQEIDKASIVATTFSTAVTPAILKNKPVIFVQGFSMKETQFYNRAMVNRYYKLYEDSDNLVHYKDVAAQLDSIQPISEKLKQSLFFERKSDFPVAVIEFIEYAGDFRGYAVTDCNIDNYREKLNRKHALDPRDRINNIEIERFYLLNVLSGFRLNKQRKQLLSELRKLKQNDMSIDAYQQAAVALCDQTIEQSLNYLLKRYKHHPVGFKGFYLKHLFKKSDEQACDALPTSWRIADYYYNKYLFNSNNKHQAKYYLGRYIDIAKNEDYRLTHLYENSVIRQSEELYSREFSS